MKIGWQIIKKHFPLIILVGFSFILFWVNYQPGTYLTGWDNLHPEFNFLEHFRRVFSAVWQEHQGTGTFIGATYAMEFPHLLYLWILSWVLPLNLLRYIFHISMLLVGSTGTYFVIKTFFVKDEKNRNIISLFGGLFYLLNLGTIQYFATPFEPFSTFWGMFPWMIYVTLRYLKTPTRKNIVIFSLIHLLVIPSYYVQTVFYVYLIVLFIIFFNHSITTKTKDSLKTVFITFLTFIIINLFWLLPNLYWTIISSSVQQNAASNKLVTEEKYLQSQQFGYLSDFVLLKNNPWNYKDFSGQTSQFIMQPWHDYFNNVYVQIIGYIFFGIIILGIITIKINRWFTIGLFTISFLLLANQTPIAREFNNLFRQIDIVNQVFRDPFTKFIVPTIFVFAVGFSGGIMFLSKLFTVISLKMGIHIKKLGITAFYTGTVAVTIFKYIGIFGVGLLLFIYTFPAFTGNLFSDRMRVKIPQYYFEFFDYMSHQDSTKRISDLPQGPIWGWMSYGWGYTGSGFLWHGLSQSVLNRTFDVWNDKNEEYYWEINYALNKKDYDLFNAVLNKYQISYVMFDSSLYFPDNPLSVFDIQRQKEFIEKNTVLRKVKSFGTIDLYATKVQNNKYVSIIRNAPTVSTNTNWLQNDVAYKDFGNYITSNDQDSQLYYPFRSLFSGRGESDVSYSVKSTEKEFLLSAKIPAGQIFFPQNNNEEFIKFDAKTLKPSVKIPVIYNNGNIISLSPSARIEKGTLEISIEKDNRFESYDSNNKNSLPISDNTVRLPQFSQRNGYLVAVKSLNKNGLPLRLWVENSTAKRPDQLTYLGKHNSFEWEYFILPPMAADGLGYTLHFDTISVEKNVPINELSQVVVYPIPYKLLTETKIIIGEDPQKSIMDNNAIISVNHPAGYFYDVSLKAEKSVSIKSTLLLSQTYDQGWKAYVVDNWFTKAFPVFGKPLKSHELINNWENGWDLSDLKNQSGEVTVAIIFWPQYLEFLGLILLPVPFIYGLWKKKSKNNK